MTLKIIGAGLGRTGTLSLKRALEKLGFNGCYHMDELMANIDHAQIWLDAAAKKPVDWAALFAGYQATVDWPSAAFYRELLDYYPDAKVVLTTRDPESWYTSAYDTIYQDQIHPEMYEQYGWPLILDALAKDIVWQGTFDGKFEDKAHAIAVFKQHNETVQQVVPPERLLVYQVKQGWQPLCEFLQLPIPDEPFPRTNTADTYTEHFS